MARARFRTTLTLLVSLLTVACALHAQIPEIAGTPVDAWTFRYIDIKQGEGPLAAPGKRYKVHYTGWLKDGTKFDSSVDRKEPFEFVQGKRNVIPGWEAGFEGMRTGGRRRLLIPWQMAYGELGRGPIPAKADLVFDVELLAVSEPLPLADAVDLAEPLKAIRSKIVQLARAVPEDKYGWRPSSGVRSFGEVMLHVALDNNLLFEYVTTNIPANDLKLRITEVQQREKTAMPKDAIVKLLDESFNHYERHLSYTRNGLLSAETMFFGTPTTRRGAFNLTINHISEHLGQAIAYARSIGITPPWSREGQ